MLKRIEWIHNDGTRMIGIACLSYRCGPIGQWMLGDVPLSDIPGKIISETYI